MSEFVDLRHVEITLDSLMALPTPLVVELPRRPGQKETRYAHLLAGEPSDASLVAAEPATQRPEGPGAPRRVRAAAEPEGLARVEALEQEVASLRSELGELRESFDAFRSQFE
jgi:uncharacterized protein YceH (UPF0502 family)